MTKEALKLAIEAMILNNAEWKRLADSGDGGYWSAEDQDHYKQTEQAITAIKEALAQPEQEPVAWRAWVSKFPQGTGSDWVYVTKPIMKDIVHNQPLYTTPSQRTFLRLTDEEIVLIVAECAASHQHTDIHFARAIETKLKEKNT
jgi:hypothetical protein